MIICAVAGARVGAQPFETSDASSPKWYFIQVKGDGDTAGKVATEINGKVTGQPEETTLTAKAKQLWRIETAPNTNPVRYEIINKYSGKKLDVSYDASLNERIAVTGETPTTVWTIQALSGNYYTLRIVTQPAGGVSGAGYLTQGGSALNSALYFTKSSSGNDAQFQFISIDAPIVSNDVETAWLGIQSVRSALSGKYLTEVETAGDIQLAMQDRNLIADNHRRQWKIVNNPASGGAVNFVNRATGHLISSTPVYGIYDYARFADTESAGWTINTLENSQYEVRTGSVDTGKYWYAATDGEAPANYAAGASLNTGFAWKFQLIAEEIPNAINRPQYDNIRVYAQNRRIYVEGVDQYRVYTIYGTPVNGNDELPAGVYLITIKNKTTKILVK
jgi:hypothetical protein